MKFITVLFFENNTQKTNKVIRSLRKPHICLRWTERDVSNPLTPLPRSTLPARTPCEKSDKI